MLATGFDKGLPSERIARAAEGTAPGDDQPYGAGPVRAPGLPHHHHGADRPFGGGVGAHGIRLFRQQAGDPAGKTARGRPPRGGRGAQAPGGIRPGAGCVVLLRNAPDRLRLRGTAGSAVAGDSAALAAVAGQPSARCARGLQASQRRAGRGAKAPAPGPVRQRQAARRPRRGLCGVSDQRLWASATAAAVQLRAAGPGGAPRGCTPVHGVLAGWHARLSLWEPRLPAMGREAAPAFMQQP